MNLDTRVKLANVARGEIEGYAILWGKVANGFINDAPMKFAYGTGYGVGARIRPACNIRDMSVLYEHEEIVGSMRGVRSDQHGLYAWAVLNDAQMLEQAGRGLLYFSPQTYTERYSPFKGVRIYLDALLTEISVVYQPGFAKTKAHAQEDELYYLVMRAKIASYPPEVLEEAMAYLMVQDPDEYEQIAAILKG